MQMVQHPLTSTFVLITNGAIYNTCSVKEEYAQIGNFIILDTNKKVAIFDTWLLVEKATQHFLVSIMLKIMKIKMDILLIIHCHL